MYNELISWVENIKTLNHSSGTALVVMKDSKVELEYYSGRQSNKAGSRSVTAETRFNIASARKSYLGLAIAYALYEGKIGSLDDYAVDYFPQWSPGLVRKNNDPPSGHPFTWAACERRRDSIPGI